MSGKPGPMVLYDAARPARQLTGSERAGLSLLLDHERLDTEIAEQVHCDVRDVAHARRVLEQITIASIPRWRPGRKAKQQLDQAGAVEALSVARTGRSLSGVALANALKARCKRGHELTPANVSWIRERRSGRLVRRCKACHRIRERASRGLPPGYVPATMPRDRERCPAGHPFEGDNLIMITRKDGHQVRRCRECHNAQARERLRARRQRERQERELVA